MAAITQKQCLSCGAKFHGRIDKKFCSDTCRVDYNNKLNADATNYVRNVSNILRKNRRILLTLNPTGKVKVPKSKLLEKGFDFTHFTSIYQTKDSGMYCYCFEQGYLPIDNNYYLLVVKKEI